MKRRLFQDSAMMQNASHVAVRHIGVDAAFFQDFEVVQRKKAAIGTHLSRLLATLALHPVYHRHQQPVVVQLPADFQTPEGINHSLADLFRLLAGGLISTPAPPDSPTSLACSSARSPPLI